MASFIARTKPPDPISSNKSASIEPAALCLNQRRLATPGRKPSIAILTAPIFDDHLRAGD
jgi:hypothetical protein